MPVPKRGPLGPPLNWTAVDGILFQYRRTLLGAAVLNLKSLPLWLRIGNCK